jgi:hypothetical protein
MQLWIVCLRRCAMSPSGLVVVPVSILHPLNVARHGLQEWSTDHNLNSHLSFWCCCARCAAWVWAHANLVFQRHRHTMVVAGRDAQLCWFVGTCVLWSQRLGVVDARYAAFVPHVAHAAGGLARHGGLMAHSSASHASVCGLWLHVLLKLLVVPWQPLPLNDSVLLQLRRAVSLG